MFCIVIYIIMHTSLRVLREPERGECLGSTLHNFQNPDLNKWPPQGNCRGHRAYWLITRIQDAPIAYRSSLALPLDRL